MRQTKLLTQAVAGARRAVRAAAAAATLSAGRIIRSSSMCWMAASAAAGEACASGRIVRPLIVTTCIHSLRLCQLQPDCLTTSQPHPPDLD